MLFLSTQVASLTMIPLLRRCERALATASGRQYAPLGVSDSTEGHQVPAASSTAVPIPMNAPQNTYPTQTASDGSDPTDAQPPPPSYASIHSHEFPGTEST